MGEGNKRDSLEEDVVEVGEGGNVKIKCIWIKNILFL